MKLAILGTLVIGLLVVSLSSAQNTPDPLSELNKEVQAGAEKIGQATKTLTEEAEDYTRYKLEEESNRRLLALCVMGTAVLSLLLVLAHLYRRQASPETLVNGSGLVLVIFATVLVVILAKADQQLTAATGILGAIAGYLFGKATRGPVEK